MTTHAEYLAAIDKALDRLPDKHVRSDLLRLGWDVERRAQLDLCRAILLQHEPGIAGTEGRYCRACLAETWPCPTVQIVDEHLTRMGAL